jgi:hypothetical protein
MKRSIVAVSVGAVGALALGVGVPALALDDGTSSGITATTSAPTDDSGGSTSDDRASRRAEAEQRFAEKLADELGIDADRVAEALQAVRDQMQEERLAELEQRLADAVQEGRLTQEQADALLERAREAQELGLPGLGRGLGRGHHGLGHGFGGPGGAPGGPGWWGEHEGDGAVPDASPDSSSL